MKNSARPAQPPAPAPVPVIAPAKPIVLRPPDTTKFTREPISEPLHLDYRIHWRTEFKWRNARLPLLGECPVTALTPESACEAFAEKFPGRDILQIVAV